MQKLRKVPLKEAIGHSLWEAHACIGQFAFCACLAMLRKALDLWSAEFSNRNGMTFDKSKKEKDVLFWRLKKIADENKLYEEYIHEIIDGLRLNANEAVHESTSCFDVQKGTYDVWTISNIRQPYIDLHQQVIKLITMTLPGVRVVYSDNKQWKEKPPL